jgi:hypothetical protein
MGKPFATLGALAAGAILVGCAADSSTDDHAPGATGTGEDVVAESDVVSATAPYVCFYEHERLYGRFSCWNLGEDGLRVSSLETPHWCPRWGCLENDTASSVRIVGGGKHVWLEGYEDADFGKLAFERNNFARIKVANHDLGIWERDRLSSFVAHVAK